MNDRNVRILEILAARPKVKITFLAEVLNVSQVTLRRDLDYLERRGIIRRFHGYTSLDGANNTSKRMAYFYSVKQRIAKTAAQIVEEGETIMLESGSCCALLAEELALADKNITIVTNSVFIANYISNLQTIKVILLGGYFQRESQMLVGPITKRCAKQLFSGKFFLGADGFIPEYGFTGRDYLSIEIVCEMARHAKNVFVLTEADKFNRRGAYKLIQLEKLTGIFTDDSIPKEAEAALIKSKVQLYKVPSKDEKIKWCQFPGQTPILYNERD